MFNSSMTKGKTLFWLGCVLGACYVVWLMLTSIDFSNAPIIQSQHQGDDLIPTITSMEENSSRKQDFNQAKHSLDPIMKFANGIDNNDSRQCSEGCSSTLSMLNEGLALSDETFHKLGAYAKEIASYLKNNESKRQYYLDMALTTTDADKRSFITDIFTHLPYQQKSELGERFIGSENWRVRADGVRLIADHNVSNFDTANILLTIFSSEENAYIKGSILNHLKQSPTLRGDIEVLYQLDSAIYNETDTSVRVAALKAKMQLSEQPYHILPDALQALRTSDPELQLAGLVAIEQVLEHEKKSIQSSTYIDTNSIRNEFEIIRNLTVYGDDKKRFDRLIREANTIYLRHFEY